MMSAAAGLYADDARRKLLRQSNQCRAPHPTPHYDRTGAIEPHHAAHVLAEVDAKDRNIHSHSSF